MLVLGIETTCDETSAAIVRKRPEGGGEILANEVLSQIADMRPMEASCPKSPPAPMSTISIT